MKKVLTGAHAVSQAARLARVQVIAAYPITPQTSIVEELADMCLAGRLKARFLKVESEHSVMASIIAASTAGARAFTATSSHGLALMHEVLHWAAGARLPIVLANVNRTLGPPWNILCDHQDSLSQRDTGWIQIYVSGNQEVLDATIQAFKLAEAVNLPVMVNLDGFFLSHTAEAVDLPDQAAVDDFLPSFDPDLKLDLDDPKAFNVFCMDSNYVHFKHGMQTAMDRAVGVAAEVDEAFRQAFGRGYGLVEGYRLDGAETAVVAYATIASTARAAVDRLRDQGRKVGLLKIRLFRPFPAAAVRAALTGVKRAAVIDRNCSYGSGGIFAAELRNALYHVDQPPLTAGYVAGIGGADVTPELIIDLVDRTEALDGPPPADVWIGVKQ